MATKPKVTSDVDLNKIRYWSRESSRVVGAWTVQQVKERVQAGEGSDGNAFAAYSAAYARKKGKTRADLHDTGAMLASLKVQGESDESVAVGPTVPYAEHVDARRPWLALAPDEIEALDDQLSKLIDKEMGKAKGSKGGLAG